MSAEATMEALPLCPQPRRSFGWQFFQSKAVLSSTTPESYHTQACHELQELLSGAPHDGPLSPECGRSFVTPPLSTASTSVGPSPHANERLSPVFSTDSTYGCTADPAAVGRPRKGSGVAAEGQKRKLFVGGIPQDMDQDMLREEFSCFGAVKKAWIQRAREGGGKYGPACHRGFGFVIFRDDEACDNLLEGELSKFIYISGGCKVEVKRALSSREMTPGSQWSSEIADTAGESVYAWPSREGLIEPHACPTQTSAAGEVAHSPPVFFAVPVLSSMPAGPAVQSPHPAWGNASPLPGVASTHTGYTGLHPTHGFSAMHRADLAMPAIGSPEFLQLRAAELYGPELASALMCAMPDHYED